MKYPAYELCKSLGSFCPGVSMYLANVWSVYLAEVRISLHIASLASVLSCLSWHLGSSHSSAAPAYDGDDISGSGQDWDAELRAASAGGEM